MIGGGRRVNIRIGNEIRLLLVVLKADLKKLTKIENIAFFWSGTFLHVSEIIPFTCFQCIKINH